MTTRNGLGFGLHRHNGSFCPCGASAGRSRRQFIATAAAFGASTILAAPPVLAQTQPKLIDVHHHIVPPLWFEEVKPQIIAQGGGRIVPTWFCWSPQRAVEEMDKNGVATAIISMTTPGIWFGDVAQGLGGIKLFGEAFGDYAGNSVGGAGDVNGDGFDDVIVGAP